MAGKLRRLKFPEPGATKEKEPILMINAERMLRHWNQDHPDGRPMTRVTPKVASHTGVKAMEAGWAGATAIKDAITGHTSGMALLRGKKVTYVPDPIDADVLVHKPKRIRKE